jgi:hypothetical protein
MQQEPLTDTELDALILARLKMAGIDLSVLPADDEDAEVDQRRILSSARRFLRSTPAAIRGFAIDPQDVPPVMYPGMFSAWTSAGEER